MTTAVSELDRSVRGSVSPAEWRTRVDLAAFYRLAAHYGMDDFIYNHISARVSGEAGRFLVSPFGQLFGEVTASSLIKIDQAGAVLASADPNAACNIAVPGLHGVILNARSDLNCVAHIHTPEGMAVSAMTGGLAPLTQTAMQLIGRTAYLDYEHLDEPKKLVEALGDKDILILRHHGLVACGRTITEAFLNIYNLVYACKAQVMAMAAGELSMPPTSAVVAPHYAMGRTAWHDRAGGVDAGGDSTEWRAALRMLDRHDPSFRD